MSLEWAIMAEKDSPIPPHTGEIPLVIPTAKNADQYIQASSSTKDSNVTGSVAPPQKIPPQLKVLIVAAFAIALGFGLIAPVLPRFAASFNVGAMAAALVVSMFAVMRLAFAPASGKIITLLGERPTYIAGLLIVALSSLGVAFSWDFYSLLLFRALGGVGSVMFTVSAMGLIVRYAPQSLRGRISGYYATSFLLGNILGPVMGATMAGLGMRLPFTIYAVMLFIAATVVFVYLKEVEDKNAGAQTMQPALTFKQALGFENYRGALVTNFAMGWAALGIRISLMPLAAVALLAQYHSGELYDAEAGGTVLAGVALALYAAGNAVTQNISGSLSDKSGRRTLIFVGLLLSGASTIAVGFSTTPVIFCVFSVLTGIGTGLLGPSLQASVADVIGSNRSGGTVLSTFQMLSDLGQIVGPLLAGFVVDQWGYGAAFGISGALLILCSLAWRPGHRPRFPAQWADKSYSGK